MFERFTDRARRTIVQAQEESRALNHNHIGPEHILLALMNESKGMASQIMTGLGLSQERVRDQLGLTVHPEVESPTGRIPFTPQAKETLELSLRESLQLGDTYIGTEHILFGLIRQGESEAADALRELGVDLDTARARMIELREAYGQVRVARRPQAGEGLDEPEAAGADTMRAEVHALRVEVSRLRALLEEHGINPDEDSA